MNGLKTKLRGSFSLVGNTLYAANDGNPFDRDGVIALCITNLSSKSDEVIDSHANTKDSDWIPAFCRSQLQQYLDYPNTLTTQPKEEARTSGDYSGRWLLELLQNMDDAMGPKDRSKYIGTKGLGFLSVMQIGEDPEIFSGSYNFLFSQQKTKNALISDGVSEDRAKNAPRFQVPWPATPDKMTIDLLKSGFKTVIKLKIREDSLEDVKEQLQSIEHQFLLFSQNIDELQVSFDTQKISFQRSAKLLSGDHLRSKSQIDIVIERTDQKKKTETWAKWQRNWESAAQTQKRSSCMFCLQRKGDICVPTPRHTKVYNFYPTEQSSEIRGYLHLSFELTSDRKALQMWGDKKDASWKSKSCDPENKRLVAEAKAMIIEDVIDDPAVPTETILKTFSSLNKHFIEDVKKGEPLKRVQAEVIAAIKKHSFLPRFGGGATDLNRISVWENDYIGCLVENERIQEWDLAPKSLESCFAELQRYNVDNLSSINAIRCLANSEIRNENAKCRNKLAKTIAGYVNTSQSSAVYETHSLFTKIKFLSDQNKNVVCLADKVFVSENIDCPSFLSAPRLSKASSKDLNNEVLENKDVHRGIKEQISRHFISNDEDLFLIKFLELLEKSSQSDNKDLWKKNGFEMIRYAFQFYKKNGEEFRDFIEDNEGLFFLPSAGSSDWELADDAFFSASWLEHGNLKSWFEKNAHSNEFLLLGFESFVNKLFEKNKNSVLKENQGRKASKKKLMDFLGMLGVKRNPRLRPAFWSDVIKHPQYAEELDSAELTLHHADFKFEGLIDFLTSFDADDALVQANEMLQLAQNTRAHYFRKYARSSKHVEDFKNIAHFQLFDGKWLKLSESPLNPSGFFSLKECFLSAVPNRVFPSISSRNLKKLLGTDATKFIKGVKLSDLFEPDLEVWINWIGALGNGYRRLLKDGHKTEKLNAQIHEFFQSFLVKEEHSVAYRDSTLVPSKSSDPDKIEFEFLPASSVFVNNTTIDDRELASVLSKTNVAIFALGLGEAKGQDLSKRLGLRNLTEKFDVKTQVEQINQRGRQNYHTWISSRWDIFQALDSEFGRGKSARLLEELTDSLTVCDSLLLNLNNNETGASSDQIEITPKYYGTPSSDGQSSKVYILDDENKRNLIEYLCIHFFKWRGRTELISVLMADPIDLPTIRDKLTQNSLPFRLIDNFKALHKSQEEEARRAELEFKHEQHLENIEKKKRAQEQLERMKARRSELRAGTSVASHGDKKASNDDDLIDTNKTTGGLPSINKGVSNEKRLKPEKVEQEPPQLRPRKSRSGFGTRVSGHLRARNDNEVVGRSYFDDDDNSKPENKRIGDKAEVLIKEFIEAELQPDNVELLGGNNTGFDIQYKLNGLDYFVEVKGLSGSWNESDVLLSSAQFEKAQKEGEKYSIFVVEFVDDNSQRSIWEIRNPAHYFKKMQIDHGWRNFALSHNELQPTVGRYLICEGEKFKIEKVDIRGLLARLYVENRKKPIVFKPNEMTIEKGDDE